MNQTSIIHNGVTFNILEDGFEIVSVDGIAIRFDKYGNVSDGVTEKGDNKNLNLARVFEGQYVVYTPTLKEYVVPAEKVGDLENQVFYPHKHTLWRVFRKDGARCQLIPVRTIGSLALNGVAGFEHGIDVLNDLSAAFVNFEYAESGESIGNSIASRKLNNNMIDFSLQDAASKVYTDNEWENDYLKLRSKGAHRYNETIYLASRKTLKCKDVVGKFQCIMEMGPRGGKNIETLFSIDAEEHEVEGCRVIAGVVPKITLKPEVRFVEGNGSLKNPWRLEI